MKKRFIFLLLVSLSSVGALWAADDLPAGVQFQQAFGRIRGADQARNAGDHKLAMELYRLALKDYVRLARRYPDWQVGSTRYRVAYCQEQLQLLMDAAVRQARVERTVRRSAMNSPLADAELQGQTVEQRAMELVAHGRYADAHMLLLEAMRDKPDDLRIRQWMGIVRCCQGEFLDAVYVLEPVVEEQPGNADSRVALATAYVGLGRTVQAMEQLNAALKANPDQQEAHYNLAQLLIRMEDPDVDLAERHYRFSVAAAGEPDPEFEVRLAQAREKAGILSRLKFW